jgi:hypothetical protein
MEEYEGYVLPQIERDALLRSGGQQPGAVRVRGRDLINEAQARKYLVDPLLRALGWDVSNPAHMIVEDPVDPPVRTAGPKLHRRFLDYHGRECQGDEGRSLIVIEAKRPSEKLPDLPLQDIPGRICAEITAVHSGGPTLGGDWHNWIATLVDYCARTESEYKRTTTCVVQTNGEWFVVFSDVNATLLSKQPEKEKLYIFESLAEVEQRAQSFFQLLNYRSLAGYIPPQHPAALRLFLEQGSEVPASFVLEIAYGRYGARQPSLAVRLAALVWVTKGAPVWFEKHYADDFVALSSDSDDLQSARKKIQKRAEELLQELRAQTTIKLLSAKETELLLSEFQEPPRIGTRALRQLFDPGDGRTFRLLTGDTSLFLLNSTEYDLCPHHDWGQCRQTGDAIQHAIYEPTIDPLAFFASGSEYHCAHQAVHAARQNKCVVARFEQHLCCRRCAYMDRCWPDGGAQLPCKRV